MVKRQTSRSTPKLSEVARHVVIPEGIVSTAWPRVVAKCRELGVEFEQWQHGIGSAALGKRADGKYAATVGGVVLSIPRQVGKTFLVGMIVIALCLLFPGLTVLWSAHRTRTATKTFGSLKGYTSRPRVKAFMLEPRNTNGEQEIRFRNGSVIMFGAREQGFGRGFDEVDVEVFDEAQILSEKALEDMVAATNQSRQESGALLFFMGTPPRPADPGEEFASRRRAALAVKGDREGVAVGGDMLYAEFSADEDADPDDPVQWAKANPSFPVFTSVEAMKRLRANLRNEGSFRREALGIWDKDIDAGYVVSRPVWDALAAEHDAVPEQRTYGVAFSADGLRVAVAGGFGWVDDGVERVQVELLGTYGGAVEASLVPLAEYFTAKNADGVPRWRNARIVLAGRAGAALLEDLLVKRGVPRRRIEVPSTATYFQACGQFLEGVHSGTVSHRPSSLDENVHALDESVLHAAQKFQRDGAWRWMVPDGDETPVEAVSLAYWGVRSLKPVRSGEVKAVIL